MATEELVSYITSQLNSGVDKNHIIEVLQSHGGWELSDITKAFLQIEQEKKSHTPQVVLEHKQTNIQQSSAKNSAPNSNANNSNNSYASGSVLEQAIIQKKSASSFGLIIALVVVFFIAITGVVYGYFEYVKKPTPHQILGQMIVKQIEGVKTSIKDVSNVSLDIKMFDDLNPDKKVFANIDLLSDFVYDTSSSSQPFVDGFLTISGNAEMSEINKDTPNAQGKGTIDVKIINQVVYFRARDIEAINNSQNMRDVLPLDLYENKWVKFDINSFDTNTKLEEKIIQIFNKFFNDNEILELINRSGQVKSITNKNNEKEYHLTFQIKKDDWVILTQKLYQVYKNEYKELVLLFLETSEIPLEWWGAKQEKEIQEIFTEIEKQFASQEAEKVFTMLENLSVESWVNINTMLPRKIITSFNTTDILISTDSEKVKLNVSFSGIKEKEYDVPMDTTIPIVDLTLEEVLEDLLGPEFPGLKGIKSSKEEISKTMIKARFNVLQSQPILYYNDHAMSYGTAKTADTNCTADLFADTTVATALASAVENGSGDATCAIGFNGQSWAVSVPYKDGTGSLCADNTGYTGNDIEKNTATMANIKDDAICGPGIKNLNTIEIK